MLWLCLEELRPGSVVLLSEWGFYSGICKIPLAELFLAAAGSKPQAGKLAGKPHPAWLLTWTLVLSGKVVGTECLGLRHLKAWTPQNELPPLLALTTPLFANKER